MSTANISSGTLVSIAPPSNDNAQNNILAIDTNNIIKYISATSLGISANQSLNTTDNVTFNNITTPSLLFPSGSSTASPTVDLYGLTLTTSNATPTTILSYATSSNTNYLMYVEMASKDSVSGGGAYIMTKRITNIAGTVTIAQLEGFSSTDATISTSAIQVIVSGTNALVQVTGVSARTLYWTAYIRVIIAS